MADPRIITKALGGEQDLLFGEGAVMQQRSGTATSVNKINAETIPYSGDTATSNKVSVRQQINKAYRIAAVRVLTDADAVLTATDLLNGLLQGAPTLARVLTTPTAAEIVAAVSGGVAGDHFNFSVVNTAAFNLTVTPDTGVTAVGNMVVNNASGLFKVVLTDPVTPSVTIYRIA
jgi:outer membrane lipoprotein SlyB